MSIGMLELIVIVLAGILIVSIVYEVCQRYLKWVEDKREEERAEAWRRRQNR